MSSSPRRASHTVDVQEDEPRGAPVWIAAGEARWNKGIVESREEAEDGSVEFTIRIVDTGECVRVPQTTDGKRAVLPRNVFTDSRGVLDVHDLIARPRRPERTWRLERGNAFRTRRRSRTCTSRRSSRRCGGATTGS